MTAVPPHAFHGRKKPWRIAEPINPADAKELGDLPSLIADLLHHRGLRTADEVHEFLDVSESLLEDPESLPDMGLALERLEVARDRDELVAVYGDFDADGVTGTALLVRALDRFGIRTLPYIPHRVEEGHGLNPVSVRYLREQGVNLILTVDCGVTDTDPIALARSLGMDTIVTDHHTVSGALPNATAIINPRAPGSVYPFDHLTGVGMALKLAQTLLEPTDGAEWAESLLELAAIGTVTDMAPLVHENRYIVHRGLDQLRRTTTLGLQVLMRAAGVEAPTLGSDGVGFAIGPRLNAAGRLDHAMDAYRLLMTKDPAEAEALVVQLERHNDQRRYLTDEAFEACRQAITQAGGPGDLILEGSPEYNPGIVGLVAGRLAEEFGVPAAVYALDGSVVRASSRGAPSFHWAQALASCHDLLDRYGGHAQAAGFTCDAIRLPELRERLLAVVHERLPGGPVGPEGYIDAEVALPQLMGTTLQTLRRLEPFGVGNPAPVFLTKDVLVEDVRTMGADGQHLRLRLRSGGATWVAVAFRQPWQPGIERADIVYSLDVDHWGGTPRLRLTIHDYAPA